jgi:hypothetical protein
MKHLAETMASSIRETSSEVVEWTREASERQAEATRQITQARSIDEVLDTQNRYVRENLQALLDFSAIHQFSPKNSPEKPRKDNI